MDMKQFETIHLFVSGRVQGVNFRTSTLRTAHRLGITGFVRNTPDGRVEILAEGSTDAVERLLAWCHEGPPSAVVMGVEIVSRNSIEKSSSIEFKIR